MDLPGPVSAVLLVALGYALSRVVDLASDWARSRVALRQGEAAAPGSEVSATGRQRLVERHAAYEQFRVAVNKAINAAVNDGHGNYGMLYGVRDAYSELMRRSSADVVHAAESVIRCVTLLVNLGPSDERYAMFTRALSNFDKACGLDSGVATRAGAAGRQTYSVIGSSIGEDADKPSGEAESAGGGSVQGGLFGTTRELDPRR